MMSYVLNMILYVLCFGQPPAVATHITRGFTMEIQSFNPGGTGGPSHSGEGAAAHTPRPRRPYCPVLVLSCRHPHLKYSALPAAHFAAPLKASQTK